MQMLQSERDVVLVYLISKNSQHGTSSCWVLRVNVHVSVWLKLNCPLRGSAIIMNSSSSHMMMPRHLFGPDPSAYNSKN